VESSAHLLTYHADTTVGATSEVITFRVNALTQAALLSTLLALLPIVVEARRRTHHALPIRAGVERPLTI
jgi:hypothetical protein